MWTEVRGQRVHGTYFLRDGWIKVVADDGRNATEEIFDLSAQAVAERLLRRLSGGTVAPRRAIVPILEVGQTKNPVGLAGTGFLVGPSPSTLVTAKHVLNPPLPNGHAYAIAFHRPEGNTLAILNPEAFRFSPRFDIAVVLRAESPSLEALKLQPQMVPLTEDVVSFDYSATRFERRDGGMHVFLEPSTLKGNLMRRYVSDDPKWAGTPAWDTSFPAIQGASGAPVVALRGGGVVGMLLANHERHLIPAQVVKIVTGDRESEETKYFLPVGFAIRSFVIAEFLASLGIEAEVVLRNDWDLDELGETD